MATSEACKATQNPSVLQISPNLTKPIISFPSLPVLQHTALSNSGYKTKTPLYMDEYQHMAVCMWGVERKVVYTSSNMIEMFDYTNTFNITTTL